MDKYQKKGNSDGSLRNSTVRIVGHRMTEAPDGHKPVTYVTPVNAHVGHQGEGHAGGKNLRWVEEPAGGVQVGQV